MFYIRNTQLTICNSAHRHVGDGAHLCVHVQVGGGGQLTHDQLQRAGQSAPHPQGELQHQLRGSAQETLHNNNL